MSLARSMPREATFKREMTEPAGPTPIEMEESAITSSLFDMGGSKTSEIQHPDGLGSEVKVDAAIIHTTKPMVETPREKLIQPFLTVPYLLAQITLRAARTVHVFHMQSIHIARHAAKLVTLLDETFEEEKGLTEEQLYETLQLESEFKGLEAAIKKWGMKGGAVGERVEEVRRQYDRFFGERFYHPDARDYQFLAKLAAYDDRNIEGYTPSEASSSSASQRSSPAPTLDENFDLLYSDSPS